jgi:hypothetical protein
VWLILQLIPPDPVAVVLVGSDYAANLMVPHNVLGWNSLADLESLCKTKPPRSLFGAATPQVIGTLQQLDQVHKWDALIGGLKKRRVPQKTIVIVVGLHGGSSPEGAYLIPGKFAGPEDRLWLKHVIESMGRLPAEKHKVLVLEGAQISADWRLGMLHNDFARRLAELNDEIRAVKNLWVLSAAGVDQRCWASEGLGRTVFGHYLIEGLRGKAGGKDEPINLRKLHAYVLKNVSNWVWAARGAIQEPVLLPALNDEHGRPAKGRTATARGDVDPAAEVSLATVRNAPAFQEPATPDRAELRTLWKEFDQLNALLPRPSVYSPRRWRRYQAELVRFDALVCAGAESKAKPLRDRITEDTDALKSERFLKKLPASAENTLAMHVLTGGLADDPKDRPRDFFVNFWEAPLGSEEEKKIWEQLSPSEAATVDTLPSLKIRADEYLLERASADQAFQKAAGKLEITHQRSDSPQPAEAHFLRMIARWFPAGRPSEPQLRGLISRALEVRRLAERAAVGASVKADVYSRGEQVYPWITAKVEAADRHRRMGEDLLLSSEKRDWDRAGQALAAAKRGYDDANERSAEIRKALALRDRALAVLPGYTHWLADSGSETLWNEWADRVEKLWVDTHALAERLEKPGHNIDLSPAVAVLSRDLNALTRQFEAEISRKDTERSQVDWQAVSAALAVPFDGSAGLTGRANLWGRFDNIRRHDWKRTESEKLDPAELKDEHRQKHARHMRRGAQIQGLLALATLGARWFDDREVFKEQAQGDFPSTQAKVSRTLRADSEETGLWSAELAETGESIGKRWLELTPEIDRLASEEKGISLFPNFQERLTKADRLGRLADAQAPPVEGIEPTGRLRETQVHDVLLAMARRAWLDHWYAEDPKAKPYFLVAGSRFIDDASKLVEHSPLLQPARDILAQKGKLSLKGPPSRVLTSERNAAISYTIEAGDDVPQDGYAVVEPVVKPATDAPLKLEAAHTGFRAVARDARNNSIDFVVASPLIARFETDPSMNRPVFEQAPLKVEGSFRGQRFDFTSNIQVHPVPDTVAIGPPVPGTDDAGIAIRASKEIFDRFGAGTGALAIVLDCSGSMKDPAIAPKFEQATSALDEVLGQVPKGTTVSVWTFSQLPDRFRGPNGQIPPQLYAEANQLKLEPERTIEQLRAPKPWSNVQIDPLIRRLKDIQPYFDTPLVHAMLQAAQCDLGNAKGLKTLLVLTDGDDNRLEQDAVFNPNKLKIPQFITERFKAMGVQINMVFFTPAGDRNEIEKARKNFEQPLRQLVPPGSFNTAANINELKAHLRRAIIRKLTCQILTKAGEPVSNGDLDVSKPGEKQIWSRALPPSIYTLRVEADKPYEREIDLREGDRIIVNLVEGPDREIAFQRALYADSPEFPNPQRNEAGDWKLAVLANKGQHRAEAVHLQIVSSLERTDLDPATPARDLHRIEQIRPGFAWFRLDARDVRDPDRQFSLRWHERIFFPGPVYHLEVPKWINDVAAPAKLAKPILKAWWWFEPDTTLPAAGTFPLDPPGSTSAFPYPRSVEGNDDVTIESIGVEDHQIEVEPDKRRPDSCLVVRMAFRGSPYIVDPAGFTGVKVVGYEHRLYSQARKYTGLFWKVNPDELKKLKSLKLLSLDALRDAAKKQNKTVQFELSEPQVDDRIPDPVTLVRSLN